MLKHLAHLLPPPLHEKRFQGVMISLITEHHHFQAQDLLRGFPIPDTAESSHKFIPCNRHVNLMRNLLSPLD